MRYTVLKHYKNLLHALLFYVIVNYYAYPYFFVDTNEKVQGRHGI